jgi:tetratricopeptide (TPR) repeat protein
MGRDQEAEAAIRRAIQIRPDGYGYHFALGVVLKTRGDLSAALEQFRAELASYPQQWAARQQVAEIQARMEQRPEGSGAP